MIRLEKVKTDPVETLKRHAEAFGEAVRQAIKPDRITVEYPRERRKYPECFRGFIVFDKEKCISCFRCAQICPANAIQMEYFENAYPGIDYAKCIFCHFCVDSCPTGALNTSKVHDIAFKAMEEMRLSAKHIAKLPEIVREEIQTVEYYVDRNTWKLVRKKEMDKLEVAPKPVVVKPRKAACADPENCLGCRLCVNVCPQNAIKVERCEITIEEEVTGTGCILEVQTELCTGCGLCVRQCPMQILTLEEVGE
ncbi:MULTISPECIES: 4Fe-4S binding protein [unclassified Archaeoglobus]|jgi:NADH-quinone oxidoreductase subunit I|uniref:4Fe-4S binding protein n=1 Tax=unclassified Archaeoglobus TaxID=2643606 RepID=UPI0025B96A75|nr:MULTISPECIES: 4Fe-4S binding protein [unclassified Archaeoglobus]